jgi:hypothetical protein
MRFFRSVFPFDKTASIGGALLLAMGNLGRGADAEPAFWQWAKTPPMGWNSYDVYGDSVTEAEVLANADYLKAHLLSHGWKFVVVDFRWYDPQPTGDDRKLNSTRTGAKLAADQFGRLLPAPNRFPSAAEGHGFKPLADRLHALGLQFGIHVMRGIPRQAVLVKAPIEASQFTAADAGDPNDKCPWCPDMFGVRSNPAGQAWYDSIFRLYATWGLDFVKVDDLSQPYHEDEIEMIRRAIDKCGRKIVLSTSPGPSPVNRWSHLQAHANMWRISGDFWDEWKKLDHQFDLLAQWQGQGGPGHWPDADMIPFGHLAIRSWINSWERWTRFTKDEQTTLMSLWALSSSPLMVGMNLPDNDDFTLALLTNDEVLAVDQDPLGHRALRVAQTKGAEVWARQLQDGSWAIGLFNRSKVEAPVTAAFAALGLRDEQRVRDLWQHKDLGLVKGALTLTVPAHGSALFKLNSSNAK